MCSVHTSTGGTSAACKGSDRASHSCVQLNKEIAVKIAGENQGDRGTTHVCRSWAICLEGGMECCGLLWREGHNTSMWQLQSVSWFVSR
jgi:hypothetical protein